MVLKIRYFILISPNSPWHRVKQKYTLWNLKTMMKQHCFCFYGRFIKEVVDKKPIILLFMHVQGNWLSCIYLYLFRFESGQDKHTSKIIGYHFLVYKEYMFFILYPSGNERKLNWDNTSKNEYFRFIITIHHRTESKQIFYLQNRNR